jgi:hypothetical protein
MNILRRSGPGFWGEPPRAKTDAMPGTYGNERHVGHTVGKQRRAYPAMGNLRSDEKPSEILDAIRRSLRDVRTCWTQWQAVKNRASDRFPCVFEV